MSQGHQQNNLLRSETHNRPNQALHFPCFAVQVEYKQHEISRVLQPEKENHGTRHTLYLTNYVIWEQDVVVKNGVMTLLETARRYEAAMVRDRCCIPTVSRAADRTILFE